jgi:hypothetical protein
MKCITKIMMVTMLLSMVVVMTGIAHAAPSWYSCKVIQTGFNCATGDLEIALLPTNKTKVKSYYVYSATSTDAIQNKVLAIAITALANGWEVKAYIDYGAPGELMNIKLQDPTY